MRRAKDRRIRRNLASIRKSRMALGITAPGIMARQTAVPMELPDLMALAEAALVERPGTEATLAELPGMAAARPAMLPLRSYGQPSC